MATQGTASSVDFGTGEETRLILDSLSEFLEQEVEPVRDELGETWSNPQLRHEEDGRLVPEVVDAIERIRKKSADAGFYAMNLPEEAGGDDVSNVTWYRAKKHVASHGIGLTEYVLAGPEGPKPLLLQAEGEQVEKYLEPAVAGEKSTAFAQTEPGVGSDSPSMDTRARKDGDEWVLNGQKQWITNAPYADFVQVFARTTPQEEAGRYGGITCFVVEADEFELGSMNNAVGMKGMQAELIFDDVRLGEDRVLGQPDTAFYNAMDFLSLGRLELGAEAVGYAEHLIEQGVEYANEREAFGRPIGKFQGISHKLAEGRARNFAADAAGLKLAWLMDEGEQAIEEASIFKYFASNVYFDIADDVVQVHGANGLSEDNPFMDHLHVARILRVVEGTDEIQLNTVAKQLGVS
ncbi:acyl-CoA dehydrogenase [Halorientalis sp. IM1011]|uniref:acyl-CoA dehydrogenase family protein n=1 Tax=Halorientalis sp. IM1011 TaxID=1932360 RepID=UPI00097CD145|nr:acyl-CoA dehydrogenase family protein [Halorientalis sp. IM1011]AQL44237.1 acyl-CoA dehydrogenase [Halorientalis sp. IM1011]